MAWKGQADNLVDEQNAQSVGSNCLTAHALDLALIDALGKQPLEHLKRRPRRTRRDNRVLRAVVTRFAARTFAPVPLWCCRRRASTLRGGH
jgi:hypothetical protein